MKVVELINKLNEIGYDENTELSFSCVDGSTGNCYEIPFEGIAYGETLTGEPYHNDAIDIGLDVDACEEYIKSLTRDKIESLTKDIEQVLNKYAY